MSISSAAILLATLPLGPASHPAAPVSADPTDAGSMLLLCVLFFTALSLSLAVRLGVFRPQNVIGPKRLPDRGTTGALLLILFIGLCTWLFTTSAFYTYKQTQWLKAGVTDIPRRFESLLRPADMAFVSTVPPILAFLVILASDRMVDRGWIAGLGIPFRKLGRGIAAGILGFLVIGPVVYWTLLVQSWIDQALDFQHPTEHPLLKSLGQSEQGAAAASFIALGATVCAPLFEELLFRGHLQTFFRHAAMRMSAARQPPLAPVIVPTCAESPEGVMGAATPAAPPVALRPAAWHGWVAIVLTSGIFAMFHPVWMWAPIFVLSLGLGYVYERTGNLWATITMHCLFNGLNTLQYILEVRGHG
jgi:membrane protease YdiL (CAAX protease family)